jgi:dUTP pyrophosphatase
MKIQIKKLYPDAKLPHRAHLTDAGADLYAYIELNVATSRRELTIDPGETPTLVDTGFTMAIPDGYEAQIRPRSGLACKHGITVANSPGTIDSGFRGSVKVGLVNLTNYPYVVNHGDRIAQMIISKVELAEFEEVYELDDTDRGTGGFGSSGG